MNRPLTKADRYMHGQKACEKVLNIINQQGMA